MKMLRKIATTCFALLIACTLMIPFVSTVSANAQYEIVFKGGLHGTVNNEPSVSYRVNAGDMFPDEPVVLAADGYVFTGWNKALPEVGSKVDRKLVYVAKYDVLVEGISYIVHYVNEKKEPIATSKSMMREAGSNIIERAKIIPGYQFKKVQQEFVLTDTNREITFEYVATDVKEQIRYEEEIINVGEDATLNENNNNPEQEATNDPEENNKNETNEEDINDKKETPLAKGENDDTNMTPYIVGSVVGIGIIIALALLVVSKRKEETN